MRLSCAVRAHPSRRDLVDRLVDRLGIGPDRVVWDQREDSWDTGARAWEAHDPDADWHLVIEDDAVVCRDLLPGLAAALDHVPPRSAVSCYLGNRAARSDVVGIVDNADVDDPPWLRASTLVWGVAIAAPTASVDGMLRWCGNVSGWGRHVYDTRIARYYAEILGWPAYYTWPSLVDHRSGPSLLGHPGGRHAVRFAGEDASALAIDWDRGVKEFMTMARVRMKQPINDRYQGVVYRSPAGRVVDLPHGLAAVYVERGAAEEVASDEPAEQPSAGPESNKAVAPDEAPADEPEETPEGESDENKGEPVHVGGGWYEWPDGSRTRGKPE